MSEHAGVVGARVRSALVVYGIMALALSGGPERAQAVPVANPAIRLSTSSAPVGATVRLKISRVRRKGDYRLYLGPSALARRSVGRSDRRLYFVALIRKRDRVQLTFVVPPLPSGRYVFFWCSTCSRTDRVTAAAAQLRIEAIPGDACPTTSPIGGQPPGVTASGPFRAYGNGLLWALVPVSGRLTANESGGFKMRWFASLPGRFEVTYRPFFAGLTDERRARTGQLEGQGLSSTMSQFTFDSDGCWVISGRVGDVALSLIVDVSRAKAQTTDSN